MPADPKDFIIQNNLATKEPNRENKVPEKPKYQPYGL